MFFMEKQTFLSLNTLLSIIKGRSLDDIILGNSMKTPNPLFLTFVACVKIKQGNVSPYVKKKKTYLQSLKAISILCLI